MATDKQQGTCSVCLRPMQLYGDRPIRHGFSAIGVRHGSTGGWHTGPCGGVNFPHLGISDEGTKWALRSVREKLGFVQSELAHLATNPDLTWHPKRFGKPELDLSKAVIRRFGDKADYTTGAPAYDWFHKRKVADAEGRKAVLLRAEADFERVLATYSPDKYPVKGAVKKVEVVHLSVPKRDRAGVAFESKACRSSRRSRWENSVKSNDPAKVTCKACRKTLGLPPL